MGAEAQGRRVDEVMAAVRREDFLPDDQKAYAAADGPLPLGWGQTNSQPRTVEAMLRLLDVRPEARVLDVGAGSGWTSALLAALVGTQGEVVAVERVPQLRERAETTLRRLGLAQVRVEQAQDGVLGWPAGAPYDRVLVSAAATRLPESLVDQLAAPGVMVVPVRGRMLRVVKDAAGDVRSTDHGAYRFVPLIDG